MVYVCRHTPIDGMNEMGLCVSVLMIEESPVFHQDTDKPDLTTTTAVRLLRDKVATAVEAIDDLHARQIHLDIKTPLDEWVK